MVENDVVLAFWEGRSTEYPETIPFFKNGAWRRQRQNYAKFHSVANGCSAMAELNARAYDNM